jgi:hypothetical protein
MMRFQDTGATPSGNPPSSASGLPGLANRPDYAKEFQTIAPVEAMVRLAIT